MLVSRLLQDKKWSVLAIAAMALIFLLVSGVCAQAAVILSDDFESGLSGWTTTGTPDWYHGAPAHGEYCVQLGKRESLQRTVSTQGYDAVTVSFSLGAKSLSKSNSRMDVLWYNGASWVLLARISKGDPTADGTLHPYSFSLPASAAGSSTFTFRVSFGSRAGGNDRGYLDDVVISGTPRTHTLTLDRVGGGSVSVNGEAVSLPWTATLPYGTELSLLATPDPSYRFGAWTGDFAGSTNPVILTLDSDKSVTANFLLDQVVLNLTGSGGTVSVDGVTHALPWSGIYAPGTSVTLEATAAAGHAFTGWSGDLTGATNPSVVTLTQDTNIAADFTAFTYAVTILGDGPGSAVVDGALQTLPWSTTCEYGTLLQVEAYPDEGYHFDSWTGDLTGTVNPMFVSVTGSLIFTAHFARDAYFLDLAGSGGSVLVDGVPYPLPVQLSYAAGTSVSVAAVPDAGLLLWAWTGDVTDHTNPLTIVMDTDLAVTADFRLIAVFSDVSSDFWAAREIAACYYADFVKGYNDGTYEPFNVVTRDQMAVYIARAFAGGDSLVPPGPATATFPDVDPSYWAYRYIEYCKANSIVLGYEDGQYHLWDPVLRDQMAVYVARAHAGGDSLVPPGPTTQSFPDVDPSYWAYRYVEYCKAQGIVQGREDGLYHPWDPVTRDQMAVYIARAFDLLF